MKGNISHAQRARILDWLQSGRTLTTTEARKELDVLHPAMRVLELRAQGIAIATHWTTVETQPGKVHRVAEYALLRQGAS